MLDTLQLRIAEQAAPILLMLAFFCFGLMAAVLLSCMHNREMARHRSGENVETFVQKMQQRGFAPLPSRLVYLSIVAFKNITFPIEPEDRLDQDLGIADEERRVLVENILAAAGRLPHARVRTMTVETVAGLVQMVQISPFQSEMAA